MEMKNHGIWMKPDDSFANFLKKSKGIGNWGEEH